MNKLVSIIFLWTASSFGMDSHKSDLSIELVNPVHPVPKIKVSEGNNFDLTDFINYQDPTENSQLSELYPEFDQKNKELVWRAVQVIPYETVAGVPGYTISKDKFRVPFMHIGMSSVTEGRSLGITQVGNAIVSAFAMRAQSQYTLSNFLLLSKGNNNFSRLDSATFEVPGSIRRIAALQLAANNKLKCEVVVDVDSKPCSVVRAIDMQRWQQIS